MKTVFLFLTLLNCYKDYTLTPSVKVCKVETENYYVRSDYVLELREDEYYYEKDKSYKAYCRISFTNGYPLNVAGGCQNVLGQMK